VARPLASVTDGQLTMSCMGKSYQSCNPVQILIGGFGKTRLVLLLKLRSNEENSASRVSVLTEKLRITY
jgi:hypothetical protein